ALGLGAVFDFVFEGFEVGFNILMGFSSFGFFTTFHSS
ncbi:MAG: hypothetical protein ACI9NQ_001994, partial [Paracoccaceae bacterium]